MRDVYQATISKLLGWSKDFGPPNGGEFPRYFCCICGKIINWGSGYKQTAAMELSHMRRFLNKK